MASKIAIVLGAGPNIGAATIQTFKANGYKVAYASRSASSSDSASDNELAIQCDLAKPASVTTLFEKVRKTWGEPNVVIYNGTFRHCRSSALDIDMQAAYWHKTTKPEESLDVPTEAFEYGLAVNTTSAFVAAREALAGFQKIEGPRTYIFTGNMLNEGPYPSFLTLGVGKVASAHFVKMADDLYKEQNVRFVLTSFLVVLLCADVQKVPLRR